MLVWGSGSDAKDLGQQELHHCEQCNAERPYHLHVQYNYAHIWYVFKWVTKRQYLLLCNTCRNGVKCDTRDVESKLGKSPIPFGARYGWAFLVALLAVIMIGGAIGSSQDKEHDMAYISAPQVNDVYTGDIGTILKVPASSPDANFKYGMLKLQAIEGDQFIFTISKTGFNKLKGVNQDLSSGKYREGDYFGHETVTLTRAEVKTLRENGTFNSIKR